MTTIKKDRYLWLAWAAGLIVMFAVMLPRFLDPFSTEDDFLNWYWMYRFQDPELFPTDFVIQRTVLEVPMGSLKLLIYKTSPLYGLLFQLLSPFISIVLLGKLLVFPLLLISIYYLYRISERLTSAIHALAICLLFVLLNIVLTSLVSIVGGFQRSFVLPLLLAYLYYWWRAQYGRSLIVLLLSGGIYPPLFLLLALTSTFELALSWWSERRKPAGRRYGFYLAGLFTVGLVVVILLWPSIESRLTTAFAGEAASSISLAEDSKFGPNGRVNLFNIYPLVGRGGIADHGTTSIIIMFLALFTAVILAWQPRRLRDFPRIFKTLFGASWFTFGMAWALFLLTASFPIYLPSRYTQASLLLILFIFVGVHGPAAVQAAARWIMTHTRVLVWGNGIIAGLILVLAVMWPQSQETATTLGRGSTRWLLIVLAGLLLVLSVVKSRQQAKPATARPEAVEFPHKRLGFGLLILAGIGFIWLVRPFMDYTYFTASAAQRELYAYIQTLPKDTLLAGSPDVNGVPMYGRRQVFYSRERLGASDAAVVDALVAYYAPEPGPILAFCEQYNVDYLIINQHDFAEARSADGRYFYEPYHSMAVAQIGPPDSFFLETIPDSAKSFSQDEWSIIACTEEVLREKS